ncbi:MAG: hypothetical protein EBR93_06250, partial [Bacteroidetes bacterium]|nr:hypothetical protein [Bacteroidota bacterium]
MTDLQMREPNKLNYGSGQVHYKVKPGQFINLPYFGERRRGLNIDGTSFSLEEFMKVISVNLVTK